MSSVANAAPNIVPSTVPAFQRVHGDVRVNASEAHPQRELYKYGTGFSTLTKEAMKSARNTNQKVGGSSVL